MDKRHYQRVHSNFNRNTINLYTILRDYVVTRRFQHIPKVILNFFKKIAIPISTVSSPFLFANFTYAESFKDIVFQKKGILTTDFSGENKTTWFGLGEVIENISKVIDWLKDIKLHIYEFSVDVFAFIFKMLMLVGLQTPSFIFNNSYTVNTTLTFSLISIFLIVLMTIYESIMQMLNKITKKSYTPFSKIIKRFPIVVGVTSFTPFLFQKTFEVINKLTRGIINIGGDILKDDNLSKAISLSGIDVLGMLLFDFVALGLLIPILLQGGRRWFDLFTLSLISPLALTAWIFDRHRHLFYSWWDNVKRLSVVQLVIATFIMVMGIFIYSARFISADMWVIKILIVLGALYRIANPPNFVKSYSRGEDVVDMFDSYKKTFTGVYNTLTLKNFKPLNYYRNQKSLVAKRKALRLKHGKRYVENLL